MECRRSAQVLQNALLAVADNTGVPDASTVMSGRSDAPADATTVTSGASPRDCTKCESEIRSINLRDVSQQELSAPRTVSAHSRLALVRTQTHATKSARGARRRRVRRGSSTVAASAAHNSPNAYHCERRRATRGDSTGLGYQSTKSLANTSGAALLRFQAV